MRLLYLQMIHHPDHIICQSLKTVQSGWPVCLPDPSAIEGYDPVVFSEGTHLTEPRPVICTHASYQNQRFSGAMDLIEYVNAVHCCSWHLLFSLRDSLAVWLGCQQDSTGWWQASTEQCGRNADIV